MKRKKPRRTKRKGKIPPGLAAWMARRKKAKPAGKRKKHRRAVTLSLSKSTTSDELIHHSEKRRRQKTRPIGDAGMPPHKREEVSYL